MTQYEPDSEGLRIQTMLDEMVRVTEGLLDNRVSFDTVIEYLTDATAELNPEDMRRVLIFAVIDIIKEQKARE